ncbi:MAG: hypothetical protein JST09_04645 [Bacteroidetes bacterium]|nr:hypothetical protein [Bacteroidota bacterium]MBS1607374.1 hypothetical protein [Bacteroidota bacterium]
MKRIVQKALLSMILTGGLFIGMVRGQEIKQRWITKMKNRYEGNGSQSDNKLVSSEEISLDEFEISAYHS